MRFRTKLREVDAEQYLGPASSDDKLPDPVAPRGVSFTPPDMTGRIKPYVVTAHGQIVFLANGDWVIREPDGRGFYPCKDDIFRARHDSIEVGEW